MCVKGICLLSPSAIQRSPKCNRHVKLDGVSRRNRCRNGIWGKRWDKPRFNNLYLSGEGFCWVCILPWAHSYTSIHSHLGAVTHLSADGRPRRAAVGPNSSAEANTMLRSLLVRRSNNCITFGIMLSASQRCPLTGEQQHSLCPAPRYYSGEHTDDSTVQAHG